MFLSAKACSNTSTANTASLNLREAPRSPTFQTPWSYTTSNTLEKNVDCAPEMTLDRGPEWKSFLRKREVALSSKLSTYKTVKARLCPWLSGKDPENLASCSLFARGWYQGSPENGGRPVKNGVGKGEQFENNYSTEMCSGSEAGSYLSGA